MLTAQAAVEAVISAPTAREETKQSSTEEESMESEPQAKRQNLGMDFSSLVKEAVFDSQQVVHMLQVKEIEMHSCMLLTFGLSIDLFHKWLPAANSFMSIKINLTNLVFELII